MSGPSTRTCLSWLVCAMWSCYMSLWNQAIRHTPSKTDHIVGCRFPAMLMKTERVKIISHVWTVSVYPNTLMTKSTVSIMGKLPKTHVTNISNCIFRSSNVCFFVFIPSGFRSWRHFLNRCLTCSWRSPCSRYTRRWSFCADRCHAEQIVFYHSTTTTESSHSTFYSTDFLFLFISSAIVVPLHCPHYANYVFIM